MPDVYRFERCEVRPSERQLLVDGAPAAIGGRAFDLLVTLIERHDRVVDKTELFDTVWPGLVVEENNLQVQVSSLRKLLGPNAIATIPGRGYQFVTPLDAAADRPRSTSTLAPKCPNNLPHARTRFIGREAALSDCASLLRDTRLLTLSGIGGCGKTRLAQQLAQQEMESFPDGVWFVDLGPLQEAQRVSATVAATLGVQDAQLTDHLKARRALVVMDNCEHVIGGATKSIETLLESCGALKIIATSREVLGTAGEQVFAVRSLSLPPTTGLDDMRRSEAVRLFVDHARLVVPDFDVDERNAPAIAEICHRLDGIALAIELAAARVRVLQVDDIRARLDQRFRLLTGGNRALPRHQTLQATMQWSHDLLTPPEQQLFRRLAVFAGGCTLAAAVRVSDDDADEYEVLERLSALHDKSLLLVDRDTRAQPRYRILETVRQYAEERLNEAGESDDARTRHLLHYCTLVETAAADLYGPGQTAWFATLRLEQENLLAAHAWCVHAPDGGELALRLAGSLSRYWLYTAQADRGYRLAEAALALAGEEPGTLSRGKALYTMSSCALRLGRYDDMQACADRCLRIARRLGDTQLTILALCRAACGLRAMDDTGRALERLTEARDIARSANDTGLLALTLGTIGELHRANGDLADAETLYREAIDLSLSVGDRLGAATNLTNLACVLVAADRHNEARAALAQHRAHAGFVEIGPVDCAMAVAAAFAASLGEYRTAARFNGAITRKMEETRTHHEPVDEAFIAPRIAHARAQIGDAAFDAAWTEGRALTYESAMAELDRWLGEIRDRCARDERDAIGPSATSTR